MHSPGRNGFPAYEIIISVKSFSPILSKRWFLSAVAWHVPHGKIYAIGGAHMDQNGKNLKVLDTVEEGTIEKV